MGFHSLGVLYPSTEGQNGCEQSRVDPPIDLNCASLYPCMSTLLYGGKGGTKRVPEYSRLAMGFAHVRASRYGIR